MHQSSEVFIKTVLAPYPFFIGTGWVTGFDNNSSIPSKQVSTFPMFIGHFPLYCKCGDVKTLILFYFRRETFCDDNQAGRRWEQETKDVLCKEGKRKCLRTQNSLDFLDSYKCKIFSTKTEWEAARA